MMPQECHAMLAAMLAGTAYSAPEGSPFRRTGHSVFRMAAAYESDGLSFMAAGDPVNALAAFLYGFGWLHCGAASGLLIVTGDKGCPFIGRFGWIPASQEAKLNEKTGR